MDQLNFLAARIAWLSTKEKEIFSKVLEILGPSTLRQLIETTFNLDQFEIQSGTITQKSDKEWNHVLENEEIYNKPFGKDVVFSFMFIESPVRENLPLLYVCRKKKKCGIALRFGWIATKPAK